MTQESLKSQIHNAMKAAMRAKEKARLSVIRLIQAEFKRIEVDERIEIDDARVLIVLDKMVKQRRDSANQYRDAGRSELEEQELFEIGIIQEFLPQQLTADEITAIIDTAVNDSGASSMADMGKLMALIKPQVQGRADMGSVSKLIKQKLS